MLVFSSIMDIFRNLDGIQKTLTDYKLKISQKCKVKYLALKPEEENVLMTRKSVIRLVIPSYRYFL